jgi:hypothetical protein
MGRSSTDDSAYLLDLGDLKQSFGAHRSVEAGSALIHASILGSHSSKMV